MAPFLPNNWRSIGALLSLLLAFAVPAAAQQLRFVTGSVVERWNVYSPVGQTTTITTANGRICVPASLRTAMDLCNGNVYPFVGGQNVQPVRPAGAAQLAALSQGGPVNLHIASEWTQSATGMIPGGIIPGVLSIFTSFDGRNAVAVPASGKGLASGGGPGNLVWNPLVAGVASDPGHQTFTFPSTLFPGNTVTPGNLIAFPMPTYAAVPNNVFGATYTAGPRQFGGTAAILSDTPNRLRLDFGTAQYERTNGKCRPSLPFGDCQVGFALGTSRVFTSVRRFVQDQDPNIVLGQPGRWQGHPWTTGIVSVRDFQTGGGEETFALSGTDTITVSGARHLVLVSPVINYDRSLFGLQQGGMHIAAWDMVIQTPEPGAAMALIPGLGLLGALHLRSRRSRRRG